MISVDLSLSDERQRALVEEYQRLHNARKSSFIMRYSFGDGSPEHSKKKAELWSSDRLVLLRMRTILWTINASN